MWYEFNKEGTEIIMKHPKMIGYRWIREEELPKILLDINNPNLTLSKIDKNGTKYYKTNICPICNGAGKVYLGNDDNGYMCNKCNGIGKLQRAKTYKVYTHEYGLILEKKYIEEKNQIFFDKNGINKDGSAYVYIGNTYSVKEDLKNKGAKFNSNLKRWISKELIKGYPCIKVNIPLKTYREGYIGIDYGFKENESEFCEETRLNSLLEDLIRKIKEEEKKYKEKIENEI